MDDLFRRSIDLGALVLSSGMYQGADGYIGPRPPIMIQEAIRAVIAEPLTAFLLAHPQIVRKFASR